MKIMKEKTEVPTGFVHTIANCIAFRMHKGVKLNDDEKMAKGQNPQLSNTGRKTGCE